jgi:UDP-N-acetylmuramoyl-L-alanyl-D-glutamate--2,6-diaminopimelate ligase
MTVEWVDSPIPVLVKRALPAASFVGCVDLSITHAAEHSADCRPGSMFAVMRGTHDDGRNWVADAVQRGATSLLVDRPIPNCRLPQCVLKDVRKAYAELCAALSGYPARQLTLVGVTGTNGKSTVAWMVRHVLRSAGIRTGLLGTIQYDDSEYTEPGRLTTPDSRTMQMWLASMVRRGATHAVMEMSSHALDQRRTAGVLLDAAVLTCVTQDHLDYHGSFDAYRNSKLKIFSHLRPGGLGIVNLDDAGSRSCLGEIDGRVQTYSIEDAADVTGTILHESLMGSEFRLHLGPCERVVRLPLIGRHNVQNAIAATAALVQIGLDIDTIIAGLETLTDVPGRLELIDAGQEFPVFVDYAHTEDAVRRCLQAVRRLGAGRVICVLGAGGDRDRSKRAPMGRAAAECSNLVVVTSDNPRSENPADIIAQVLAGCGGGKAELHSEIDRGAAIAWALSQARSGDVVVIAGKGHETTQTIGSIVNEFDDRAVARQHLQRMLAGHAPVQTPPLKERQLELSLATAHPDGG